MAEISGYKLGAAMPPDDLTTQVFATPSDVPGAYDPNLPFWLPSWEESARFMGWRWAIVALIAALLILAGWLVFVWRGILSVGFVGVGFKIGGLIVALAVSVVAYLRKSAARFRTDPFCIHCGYSLAGHKDGDICPECGRKSNFTVSREYKRDPEWFIKRYRARATTPVGSVILEAGPVRRPSIDGTE